MSPIFRSVSGFECLEDGTEDAKTVKDGCLYISQTHTEALHDFCKLLVFVCVDFGLERGL